MYLEVFKILPKNIKKKSIFFVILLIFATFFETLSIGLLFPIIELITNNTLSNNFFSLFINNFFNSQNNHDYLRYLILFFIFLYTLKSIYLLAFNFWQLKFSQNVFRILSIKLLKKYFSNSILFFYKKNSSELLRNTLMECKNYGITISIILKLIVEIIISFFLIFMVFYIEPQKTFFLFTSLFLITFIFYLLTKNKIYNLGKERLNAGGEQLKILNESFSGIKDIKLKSSENFFIDLYDNATKKFINSALVQQWIIESPRVIIEFIFIFIIFILIFFNIDQKSNFDSFLPILSLYAIVGFKLIPSIMKILNYFQQIKGAKVSIEVLATEFANVKDFELLKKTNKKFNFKNEINIQNIHFSYDNRKYVVSNFSKVIKKNSCTGIIGKSGSGKSTLIDLITGLVLPNKGKIMVDGIDINEGLKAWQNQIGYVSQSVYILDGSIKDNVAFGISPEDVNNNLLKECLINAKIYDFVNNLDNGVDTLLGEKGAQISGGQKQRIVIARELYRQPELLILDEATSALDEKTEDSFLDFLSTLEKKITTIIVSHRMNTLKYCDQIIEI